MQKILFPIFIILFISACQNDTEVPSNKITGSRFVERTASETNIDFQNELDYKGEFNIYRYRNFYNGGGVAVGDINNDGLVDLFFTANMESNRLYLNKGGFQFEDITETAGVGGTRPWSTGVSMADVNGDGWVDIYVCNSGDIKGSNKQNELYINQQDGTFKELAAEYGLDDRGFSTHATFFDYDRDGDLDLYLLNNSYQAIGSFNLRKNARPKRDAVGGDKLFRNDDNQFVDVSEEAGIYGSIIGFGLGVTIGDVNLDGWLDMYISNDFFERDYLYINQQDGTFSEELTSYMRSISGASMGADMADFNDDGLLDIFVTEMLPEPNDRLKTSTTFENWDRYQYNVQNGYHYQFTRNMLQLNNGNGTFSEVGRLAGVEATDWSWGALIFDMDNDGLKDLFVANGIFQDLTNQDYIKFIANEENMMQIISGEKVDFEKLIDAIPSNPVPNYAFKNKGEMRFENKASDWGLAKVGFSNGSVYADVDNDGDLDLVVNNVNALASIYENTTPSSDESNYLKINLKGAQKNTQAIGARIRLVAGGQEKHLEQMPMRGFQSTVDPRPNFGLGSISKIDSLQIWWPNGGYTLETSIEVNQSLTFSEPESNTSRPSIGTKQPTPIFTDISKEVNIPYTHQENNFVDFDRDRLLFHMLSTEGPCLAKADVNGDGREDLYLAGAKDQAGTMLIQQAGGKFKVVNQSVFEADQESEDTDALFFDADGDGDQDLYVASGGNEFSGTSKALIDRLYFNDGKGNFQKGEQFPFQKFASTSCVTAADFDQDGDQDLFVGVRLKPFYYGVPVSGALLENDGKGQFREVTNSKASGVKNLGMMTDAQWVDIDGDQDEDLIVSGEWMTISVFQNTEGTLQKLEDTGALSSAKGWWTRFEVADLNQDGLPDLVLGNHGENTRFRASDEHPITLHINDYDQNGTAEQIISRLNGDQVYPMVLRHDLVAQMPSLKKKYLKYENYKNQTIDDIFTPEQLERAIKQEANFLSTAVAINQGNGQFNLQALPTEAQLAPTYAILIQDFNDDGQLDILTGGNLFEAKPQVGRYDAHYGALFLGDGKGNFTSVDPRESGLQLNGQIRDFLPLNVGQEEWILVGRNNGSLSVLQ